MLFTDDEAGGVGKGVCTVGQQYGIGLEIPHDKTHR
jgi:hypothetical protein